MPQARFAGRVGVVTGGASGIGLGIVRRLVEEGARLVIADFNADALEAVAGELGEDVLPFRADVREEAQVQAMVEAAATRFGRLDLAFNCAGIGAAGEITALSEEAWDATIDTTLKGVFLSIKHQAGAMRESGGGAIVNISSLNGQVPLFGGAAYACAKAGVDMLTRNAALELAPHQIRVNAVAPGLTATPATAAIGQNPQLEAAFMERIPLRRWATPDEIAGAALFLASEDASYISGAVLGVDGAWATTGYPDLRGFLPS